MAAVGAQPRTFEEMLEVDSKEAVEGFLIVAKQGFDRFPWVGAYEECKAEYTLEEMVVLESRLMLLLQYIGVNGQGKTYVSVVLQRAYIRALVALNVMRLAATTATLSRNSAEATYDYHVALNDKRLTAVYADFSKEKVASAMIGYARALAPKEPVKLIVKASEPAEPLPVALPVEESPKECPVLHSSTTVVVPACTVDAVAPQKFAVLESVAAVSTAAGKVQCADVELMQLSYELRANGRDDREIGSLQKAYHAVTLVEAVNSVLVSRVWATTTDDKQPYDGQFVNLYVGTHGILRYLVRVKDKAVGETAVGHIKQEGLVVMTGKSVFDARVRYTVGDFWKHYAVVPDGRLWASVALQVVSDDHPSDSIWHGLKAIVDGRKLPLLADFPAYVAKVGKEIHPGSDPGGRQRIVLTQMWRTYARAMGALVDVGEVLHVSDARPSVAVDAQVLGRKARGGFTLQPDAIGYCYLALVQDLFREEAAESLGPWPSFQEIMAGQAKWFEWKAIVNGPRIVKVREHICHVDDRTVGYDVDGVHLFEVFSPAQLRLALPSLSSESLGFAMIRRAATDDTYGVQPYYTDGYDLAQRVGGWRDFAKRPSDYHRESDFSAYDQRSEYSLQNKSIDLEAGLRLPVTESSAFAGAVGEPRFDNHAIDDAVFEECLHDLANGSSILLAMLVFQSQWLPRGWFFAQRQANEATLSTLAQRATVFYRSCLPVANPRFVRDEPVIFEMD